MTASGPWRAMVALALVFTVPQDGSSELQASPSPAISAPVSPFDAPAKNLKVLPREWSRRQIVDRVMKTWTADLGVRCHYCHVGEENLPMTEWDFASDARPAKQQAREMYLMLAEVNQRLAGLKSLDGTATSLRADCFTCHRAHPRPRRIEQVVAATRAAKGVDAAVAQYRELRHQHLTTGGYDFSVKPLVREARALLAAKDTAGAEKVMALALELGFDTLSTRSTLAEIALAAGDRAGAVAHLEKALAHAQNPAEREFVEEQLKTTRKDAPKP